MAMERERDRTAPALERWGVLFPAVLAVATAALLAGPVLAGGAHEADEGTGAHLWQLLMLAQVPVLAVLTAHWLDRRSRRAALVLAADIALVVTNLAVVRALGL